MAIWDLLGKREGKSLRELFGGMRDKVEVGVSIGIQSSPAKMVETVTDFVKQGYARAKLKIKPGKDVEVAAAVRKEFPVVQHQSG